VCTRLSVPMRATLLVLLAVLAVASAQSVLTPDMAKLLDQYPETLKALAEYRQFYPLRDQPTANCTEDWCYSALELISTKGYPVQQHFIKTDDGFILQVLRVNRNFSVTKPVVLLQHGAIDSADTWLVNRADQSLGYILADSGFDVWIGNTRGNKYSRNHTRLNPLQKEFWDFSTDEMAQYDLPAMVNYILQQTRVPKIGYIGHSQGTSEMFANLGDPGKAWNLNNKISVFIATGPVAFFNGSHGLIAELARLGGADALALIGMHEVLPSIPILNELLNSLCSRASDQPICELVLGIVTGWDRTNFNISRLGVYVAHFMSGDSVKQLQWLSQQIKTGVFKKFDYGPAGNQQKYGQSTPPLYDLKAISVPTAFFYGQKDPLADPSDVARTMRTMNQQYVIANDNSPGYAHMEFTWGTKNANGIYTKYIDLLRRYAPKI